MKLKVSTSLLLVSIVIQLAMLSILIWNGTRLLESSHATAMQESVKQQNRLLVNSLAPALAANDRAQLKDILSLLKKNQEVTYAEVFNRSDMLMSAVGDHLHGVKDLHDQRLSEAAVDGIFDTVATISLSGMNLGTLHVGYSTKHIQSLISESKQQSTIIAAIAVLFSVGVTLLLGIFIARNLHRLKDGAIMMREGDLKHRIDINGAGEMGDVANSLNLLADHLLKTTEQLTRDNRYLDTLLNGLSAIVWEIDAQSGLLTFVSAEWEKVTGFSEDEWVDIDFLIEHAHIDDQMAMRFCFEKLTEIIDEVSIEFRLINHKGDEVWLRNIASSSYIEGAGMTMRGIMIDISEQKKAEEFAMFLGNHDALTGLINRQSFEQKLEEHIAYANRYGHEAALLHLDLVQFKYVNDSFGHELGDQVIIKVSQLIQAVLEDTDVLGRLGGDEFGIVLPIADHESAETMVERLIKEIEDHPFKIDGSSIHISAAIGIVMFPDEGLRSGGLLARADAALNHAKEGGRKQYRFFGERHDLIEQMQDKLNLESQIRTALKEELFVLHMQPIVSMKGDGISHYEALIRMVSGDELIYPEAFIDTAERYGLITQIDHWVVGRAITIIREQALLGNDISLAVNLSGYDVGDLDFLHWIMDQLENAEDVSHKLIFEITETAAVTHMAQAGYFISTLKGMGCRFALDDFGVGFSSYRHLKQLDVDWVKIDGSFVRNIERSNSDQIFVRSTVDIAASFNIKTVAEFIETESVNELLRELGIGYGQGYHLGRPEPLF
ncbi:MAG: EAL domain-containing protein [Gammaproteobacteria bacterium]|nr:EAL domain-containing protein [Gammaproteobacteria bacterium]